MELLAHVLSHIHRPSRIFCDAATSRISDGLTQAGHSVYLPNSDQPLLLDRFDIVVLDRTLHRSTDLDATLSRVSEMLAPEGKLIVYDCARETMDRRTARWFYSRCAQIGRSLLTPLSSDADVFFHQWHETKSADIDGLTMEHSLLYRFDGSIHREVYCCVELADQEGEIAERSAINDGMINAVGFTFVGSLEAL